MKEKCCLLLGIVLLLIVVSESRVIVPRALPNDLSVLKDNELGLKPAIWGPPTEDDYFNVYDNDGTGVNGPRGQPSDYDYNKPDRGVKEIDNLPGTNPERFPLDADRDERPEDKDGTGESGDENFNKPLDEEDSGNSSGKDKGLESSPDKEKPIHKDGDESGVGDINTEESEDTSDKEHEPENEEKPDEERKDEEEMDKSEDEKKLDEERKGVEEKLKPEDEEDSDEKREGEEEKLKPEDSDEERDGEKLKPEDEENPDEEREDETHKPEEDDEKKYIPDEEAVVDENKDEMPKEVDEEAVDHEDGNNNEEGTHEGEETDSIFDNPLFNLEKVKKYFGQLEKALGHVFRQTLDEAALLNGTYANTTEEEVNIDGKKYIITKSVIQGADNHSSLYVESLSSEPKINDTKVIT